MATDCTTCTLFTNIENIGRDYAEKLANNIQPSLLLILKLGFICWLVWKAIQAIMGKFEGHQIFWQAILFLIVINFISYTNLYWDWVQKPFMDTMSDLTQLTINTSSSKISGSGFHGILNAVETTLSKMWTLIKLLFIEAGILSGDALMALLCALVMSFFYLYLWAIFMLHLGSGIFASYIVAGLSPVLTACVLFSQTRRYTIAGLQILLYAFVLIVLAGIMMGIIAAIIDSAVTIIKFKEDGTIEIMMPLKGFAFSPQFFMLLFTSILSAFLHRKLPIWASNISGAQDITSGKAFGDHWKDFKNWRQGRSNQQSSKRQEQRQIEQSQRQQELHEAKMLEIGGRTKERSE
jgi:hypothetical protein